MWHLTPDLAVPVHPKMRLVERLELFVHRVHCAFPECRWSCPVRDLADADEVLTDHITQAHSTREH
jgi:hypothetical protein